MKSKAPRRPLQRIGKAAGLGLVSILALLVGLAVVPGLIGFHPVVVLSGSMVPTLNVGDVAVTRAVIPAELKIGDVVTYRANSGFITHRIIDIEETPTRRLLQTQGDANATPDTNLIPASAVVAKLSYRIPRIGFLMNFADTPMGMILLIAGPVVAMLLMWARDYDRKRSKKTQAEQPPVTVPVGEGEGA
jgi:signal peptidase